MRLGKLALITLLADLVHSYLDTSPFFLFSTSELLVPGRQLQSATSLTSDVSRVISQCPSTIYLLITQPGVSASDYASLGSATALARYVTASGKSSIRSSASIADVVGMLDTNLWQEVLEHDCGATTLDLGSDVRHLQNLKVRSPTLLKASLPPPLPEQSFEVLRDNDLFFASVMDALPSGNYTVLYTTTPPAKEQDHRIWEASKYEMETLLEGVMHLDLKRDVEPQPKQPSSNQTIVSGALFEKYQFLSPGIFMGFLVVFILLSILYVAVTGVAGMQVSYAAFDKETVQLAQKKSQ